MSTTSASQHASAQTTSSEADEEVRLPQDAVDCLRHARYLHLGTSSGDYPHVSLMNFLHVPAGTAPAAMTNGDKGDLVALICSRGTKKFYNMTVNPRVSLLVHDWSTRQSGEARAAAAAGRGTAAGADGSAVGSGAGEVSAGGFSDSGLREGGLASLLSALNADALSKHSVTLNGTAEVVEDAERTRYFREGMKRESSRWTREDVACWVDNDDAQVVLVHLGSARISDRADRVEKWKGANATDTPSQPGSAGRPLVNGQLD